jgi:hypothetical protein
MISPVQPSLSDPFTSRGLCPFCRAWGRLLHDESGLCGTCLARERAAWVLPTPEPDPMAPRPSFVPVSVGDGFGGVGRTLLCARDGITGPCWGACAWYETRDLLIGKCRKVFCEGHRAAVYRPERAA